MPPRPHPDPLWPCLCPSYDVPILRSLRLHPNGVPRSQLCRHLLPPPRRRQHGSIAYGDSTRRVSGVHRIASRSKPATLPEPGASNYALEKALEGHYEPHKYDRDRTSKLLEELILKRHIIPAPRHYKALILAHVGSEQGTCADLWSIWEEMEREGVNIEQGVLSAALRLLANHPNYVLRDQILTHLREQWIELTVPMWHDLVVGLIRERQLEMAIDKLEHMRAKKIQIFPWLYRLLVYTLIDLREFDEAIRLIRIMIHESVDIGMCLWYQLLDEASRHRHHAATELAWQRTVHLGFLNPPTGICSNVLSTAAVGGDPTLGTAVIQHLASRGVKLSALDYEALISCYAVVGDIKAAIQILCIMRDIGFEPTRESVAPIRKSLQVRDPAKAKRVWKASAASRAWGALEDLKKFGGRDLPMVAINLVLGATEPSRAVARYKTIPSLSSSPPDRQTFNILFRLLRSPAQTPVLDRSTVQFLVAEMGALGIEPDYQTYNRIVLVCTAAGHWHDARFYLAEMRSKGFHSSVKTLEGLISKLRSRSRPPADMDGDGGIQEESSDDDDGLKELLTDLERVLKDVNDGTVEEGAAHAARWLGSVGEERDVAW